VRFVDGDFIVSARVGVKMIPERILEDFLKLAYMHFVWLLIVLRNFAGLSRAREARLLVADWAWRA